MLRTSAQGSIDENDLVEVEGADAADDRKKFQDQVVAPLVDVHKIHPLKSSKTELGSDCKA